MTLFLCQLAVISLLLVVGYVLYSPGSGYRYARRLLRRFSRLQAKVHACAAAQLAPTRLLHLLRSPAQCHTNGHVRASSVLYRSGSAADTAPKVPQYICLHAVAECAAAVKPDEGGLYCRHHHLDDPISLARSEAQGLIQDQQGAAADTSVLNRGHLFGGGASSAASDDTLPLPAPPQQLRSLGQRDDVQTASVERMKRQQEADVQREQMQMQQQQQHQMTEKPKPADLRTLVIYVFSPNDPGAEPPALVVSSISAKLSGLQY